MFVPVVSNLPALPTDALELVAEGGLRPATPPTGAEVEDGLPELEELLLTMVKLVHVRLVALRAWTTMDLSPK